MPKNIEINIAKNAGFCGGVLRAFEIVKREFNGGSKMKERVLILGSLVHNENVMREVSGWGIKKVSSLRSVNRGDRVIITAHGIGENVLKMIKNKGASIFDATCPKVSLIHKEVKDHLAKGYKIVIFGDKGHKEVKGINGWCQKKSQIISSFSDAKLYAESLAFKSSKKPLFVVSQTTQNVQEFREISKYLRKRSEEKGVGIKCVDTICRATLNRQKEAKEIAKKSGGVIVVGGKNSANTERLFKIAKTINPNTIVVEELDKSAKGKILKLKRKHASLGVLSGASTPLYDIEKIIDLIRA